MERARRRDSRLALERRRRQARAWAKAMAAEWLARVEEMKGREKAREELMRREPPSPMNLLKGLGKLALNACGGIVGGKKEGNAPRANG